MLLGKDSLIAYIVPAVFVGFLIGVCGLAWLMDRKKKKKGGDA